MSGAAAGCIVEVVSPDLQERRERIGSASWTKQWVKSKWMK